MAKENPPNSKMLLERINKRANERFKWYNTPGVSEHKSNMIAALTVSLEKDWDDLRRERAAQRLYRHSIKKKGLPDGNREQSRDDESEFLIAVANLFEPSKRNGDIVNGDAVSANSTGVDQEAQDS
jgi:hypothetical protein